MFINGTTLKLELLMLVKTPIWNHYPLFLHSFSLLPISVLFQSSLHHFFLPHLLNAYYLQRNYWALNIYRHCQKYKKGIGTILPWKTYIQQFVLIVLGENWKISLILLLMNFKEGRSNPPPSSISINTEVKNYSKDISTRVCVSVRITNVT